MSGSLSANLALFHPLPKMLVPMDYQKAGVIIDDQINKTVVSPLPAGTTLHALIDACHSGTMLDLVHEYDGATWKTDGDEKRKGTRGGRAIAFRYRCVFIC